MLTPTTTIGTTIGAMSTLMRAPLNRKLARASPTAASVPSTVATTVASGATMKLLRAVRIQSSEVNRLRYQRSDQPGIGYTRNDESANDSGMITRIGSSRNSSTPAHVPRRAHQPSLSSGVA